ncbi:hypothetical protein VN97_g12307, partial [Penicillium thymicola]
ERVGASPRTGHGNGQSSPPRFLFSPFFFH